MVLLEFTRSQFKNDAGESIPFANLLARDATGKVFKFKAAPDADFGDFLDKEVDLVCELRRGKELAVEVRVVSVEQS